MKGRFSVEWLSQSSQSSASTPSSPSAVNHSSTCISMGCDRASTSGTVPETLPGFYIRKVDSMESQQIQSEPMGPAQSSITAPKKELVANNTESLQHGKILINHIHSKIGSHIKYKYIKVLKMCQHFTLFRHFHSFSLISALNQRFVFNLSQKLIHSKRLKNGLILSSLSVVVHGSLKMSMQVSWT